MKKYVFFFFLNFTLFSFSQSENQLDSIKSQLENYPSRDSIRVNLLNEVTKYYATRDISKNKKILEEAIEISKEINYKNGLIDSYSNLSSLYVQEGNYDKALELALKVKEEEQKNGDIEGIVYINTTISRIYGELQKPEKAIEMLEESISLLSSDPYNATKANAHFYLGNMYLQLKKYDKATLNFKEAKKIAKKNNFSIGVNIANSTLGVIEVEKKNYKQAIDYLNEPMQFYKKNKQKTYIAHTNLVLSTAYKGLKNYSKVIELNKEAEKIYKEQGNIKSLEKIYKELYDVYRIQQNYKEANKYLEQHFKMKDSIFSKDRMKAIEEMQTKYETEKTNKEKEIAKKEAELNALESKKNKNLFIGASLIAILILLSGFFYISRIRTKKKVELVTIELKETQKRLALEKQYKDSELKALKAQMNPHFIFNALNSIQDYIILNQKNLASDYLGKFADLIRNYLHFSDIGTISIADEIHNLKLYLELEKLRFEEELTYNFNVDKTINSEVIKIPTMLIQPYVENALKHGLLHKKNDRILSVTISKKSKKLIECIIEDNGVGRKKSKEIKDKSIHQHTSFATAATSQRLDLLNFGKEEKIGVTIVDLVEKNEPKGTKVVLHIPIIQ